MFFAILPIFYIPASIAVQFYPSWIDKRVTMIFASLFSSIAFLFVGPTLMFGFKDSLLLMGIGQALVGVFIPYMLIPDYQRWLIVQYHFFQDKRTKQTTYRQVFSTPS